MRPAISALVSAPNKVITPANTQTSISSSGEPSCAAITPGLRKIPDPITPPTTSMIVENRPSVGTSPGRGGGGSGGLTTNDYAFMSFQLRAIRPKIHNATAATTPTNANGIQMYCGW
jgi:hypothetical protein